MHNLIKQFKAKLRQQKQESNHNKHNQTKPEYAKVNVKDNQKAKPKEEQKQQKSKMTKEEKEIKAKYSQQSPIPIDKDYKMIKQITKQIKANPKATQPQIAKGCYQVKWLSYYREAMPSITTLVPDDPSGIFGLSTIGYHRQGSGLIGVKSYSINHQPTSMSRKDLLKITTNILGSIKQTASDAIVYYLADHISTSQESEHKMGLTAEDYTPVSVQSIEVGSIGNPGDVNGGIRHLCYKAIQKHCNAVYNIRVDQHHDFDDPLDDYSIVRGDLIRLKNKPIVNIKKYGKHYLNNMQLLKDLQNQRNKD